MGATPGLGVPAFIHAGVVAVDLAAHTGRLVAALRCLLEGENDDSRVVIETLARAALDSFDAWCEQHEQFAPTVRPSMSARPHGGRSRNDELWERR